ncbi:hypothetical protein Glove_365g27 [Diversispora epigaea]|uniref:Endonuclease/exonuclease/phosphatase domain-containing protein n=1 Tax=Diversispora epigaea TaxID=1348612 RepID=A0A397HCT5_9GLOM|nr:hypothetical protein Glove_365g27 [Diversispora epigaea]
MQYLENINNRLGKVEKEINQLNERVDHIQFEKEIRNEEKNRKKQEIKRNQHQTYKTNETNQTEDNMEELENVNSRDEITQYLTQIMGKLNGMENKIAEAHQRLDRATGYQYDINSNNNDSTGFNNNIIIINNGEINNNNDSNINNNNNSNNINSKNNNNNNTNKNIKKKREKKEKRIKKKLLKNKKKSKSEKITETENANIQYDKKTIKWKIATQNIKGLNNKTKQSIFWNQCVKSKLDIIFLQETNIKEKRKNLFFSHTHSTQTRKEYVINEPKEYQTWFSSIEENTKKSGHGVAITLKKNIALHTFKFKELKGYALQLLLSFKGKYIVQLITIYNPPQTTENASIRLKLKNWLIENLNEGKSKNWHTIMGGDWNITLHPEFDRKTTQEITNASTNKRKPRSSILNHVKYMDYLDAYEITNNNKEKTEEKNLTCIKTNEYYTAMSRIDAFWVDKEKKLWDAKNTEQTQWKKFQEETEEEVRRNVITDQSTGKNIDKQWNIIKQIIIKAANNNITKAKIPKNKTTKNNYHRLAIIQTINRLNRTIRKTKREINNKIDNNNKNNSKKIEKIKENINKNIKIIREKLNGKKMEKIEEIKKTEIIEEWIKNAKEIGKI